MNIFYEKGLNKEANYIKKEIEKIFGIVVGTSLKERLPLRYNKKVNGYEPKSGRKDIFLTHKDLFFIGSKSAEDDYIYGCVSGSRFFISVSRLKSCDDKPTKKLQVSNKKYLSRIRWVAVHELGHELVKNQSHYKDYIITNPITKYKTNTGEHCINQKCVMSQAEDLKMLDRKIKTTYKKYFCKKCKIKSNVTTHVRERGLKLGPSFLFQKK